MFVDILSQMTQGKSCIGGIFTREVGLSHPRLERARSPGRNREVAYDLLKHADGHQAAMIWRCRLNRSGEFAWMKDQLDGKGWSGFAVSNGLSAAAAWPRTVWYAMSGAGTAFGACHPSNQAIHGTFLNTQSALDTLLAPCLHTCPEQGQELFATTFPFSHTLIGALYRRATSCASRPAKRSSHLDGEIRTLA